MPNIAVLMTCFNRLQSTQCCLSGLYKQKVKSEVNLEVYLVDDGSQDGTSDMVKELFPQVHLVQGDGSLYWNGGMRVAWQAALESGSDYDFFVWLNDDVTLYENALFRLLSSYEQISKKTKVGALVGTMKDPDSNLPSYGGRLSVSKIRPLILGPVLMNESKPLKCDAINGNFVLIPQHAVSTIGILSDAYTHAMGDFDYGFRLIKSGFTCWVASGFCGECTVNTTDGTFRDNSLPLNKRVKLLQLPNQISPPVEWNHFVRLHGGVMWPLMWLKSKIRELFPKMWLRFFVD